MSYTIRLATRADIASLDALIPISVRALNAGHYTDRQIDQALGAVFGVDSQLIADGTYYVAVQDGAIAGCGGWSKRRTLYGGDAGKTGPDLLLDPTTEPALIRAFFVHPDHARRGIGRGILDACETAARAEGFTQLELGATPAGELLYAAMGFVLTDRFTIELAGGETLPAAHMAKNLG
jgi:GNAT superfamily N-acetyltransferase